MSGQFGSMELQYSRSRMVEIWNEVVGIQRIEITSYRIRDRIVRISNDLMSLGSKEVSYKALRILLWIMGRAVTP
jgi:hypothetical protein